MNGSAKKNLINILLIIAISAGFLIWQFRDIKIAQFGDELSKIHYSWILVAMGCMIVYWLLEASVLQLTVQTASQGQRFWSSFRITMAGQFFNTITPMQMGGQPAQLYLLVKKGMDAGAASSVLLVKFIVYQAMIVINFLLVIIFGFQFLLGGVPQIKYLVVIGFSVHLFVILGLMLVGKSKRITTKLVHLFLIPVSLFVKKERTTDLRELLDEKISSFHEETSKMSKDKHVIGWASLLTTLQLWVYFTIPYFILIGMGISTVSLYMAITFHAFIMMFATVMPTPGGTGGAEYTFTLLFAPFMTHVELFTALIIWRIITYYSCIIFGGIALMVRDKKRLLPRDGNHSAKQAAP
ncbi:lysylphosphatidylglycerol synthase transmembrane domain-containing protein [Listeria costaricensis]|uniref:lysylphosphatidylglycerol synthase transmembrane domain-containing protein n=1 Tax=Listeria costaricensis TaxID=2026604 RepID=UPI000C08CF06|nr:lysylphosphatidylglycerol synthase transmembrane domain-containing protein [Listeria costaricensis]